MSDVRVGLVGAGPWATMVHAPVLSTTDGLRLETIWARRPTAAAQLAGKHGCAWVADYADLVERCDAIAFAVPPDVQANLGAIAAEAGRALLLEKPIAADLAGAARLAEAVAEAGVVTQIVLSWRYTTAVRSFLDEAASFKAYGGIGRFVSGGMLAGPFRTPWRVERGPLLDLGPHVLDLLDASLGTIVSIEAAGQLDRFVVLHLGHDEGSSSTAVLSGHAAVQPARCGVELYGENGVLEVDCAGATSAASFSTVGREFADAVGSNRPHQLDVHRGLHLQRLIDAAERQLLGNARS